MKDDLVIGGINFGSRLIIGTGKYSSNKMIPDVCKASGAEMITLAVRRIDFDNRDENVMEYIPKDMVLLPNTSGARNAEEAVRIARLAKAMGCGDFIKIEVIQDSRYLLPDNFETLKATEILSNEGFKVLPYMNPDLTMGRRMLEAGAVGIMPLGAPIGTNRGIRTKEIVQIMIDEIKAPIIIDAGLGIPSHACEAMEMGAAAVLLNTAISSSKDPVLMAGAFKKSVEAGREAYLAKAGSVSKIGRASSPLTGFLE